MKRTAEGRAVETQEGNYRYEYHLNDHLGNMRLAFSDRNQDGEINHQTEVLQVRDYYPFSQPHVPLGLQIGLKDKYLFNGKELQEDFGLYQYDFGARTYDPQLARWFSVDPLAAEFPWQSPFSAMNNNPIYFTDPDGRAAVPPDWVEGADGNIKWDENATSQATTQEGEKYLGKNVLVGTHNRDASGTEAINTAKFDLYLESDKTGPSATIMGNTVPADITKFGTVAEGLYPAKYSIYKGDGSLLINGGKGVPTVSGNPNNKLNYNANGTLKPIGEHIVDEIFFHKGNWARESLSTNMFRNGKRVMISEGCQTGGCGQGSLLAYRSFIKNAKGFNGSYYLRSKPVLTVPKQ